MIVLKLSQKSLDSLMKIASQKLGTSPEELKKQLESGNFDKALASMPKDEGEKLLAALSNPKIAEKLLSTPQAQEIFKQITK
ncbi:MAG: hypothetical protein QM689_13165 [Oscillospiraceae bacterium]